MRIANLVTVAVATLGSETARFPHSEGHVALSGRDAKAVTRIDRRDFGMMAYLSIVGRQVTIAINADRVSTAHNPYPVQPERSRRPKDFGSRRGAEDAERVR